MAKWKKETYKHTFISEIIEYIKSPYKIKYKMCDLTATYEWFDSKEEFELRLNELRKMNSIDWIKYKEKEK